MDRHSPKYFSKCHRLEEVTLKLFYNPIIVTTGWSLFYRRNSKFNYGIDQPDVGSALICSIAYNSSIVISRPSFAESNAPLMISITF